MDDWHHEKIEPALHFTNWNSHYCSKIAPPHSEPHIISPWSSYPMLKLICSCVITLISKIRKLPIRGHIHVQHAEVVRSLTTRHRKDGTSFQSKQIPMEDDQSLFLTFLNVPRKCLTYPIYLHLPPSRPCLSPRTAGLGGRYSYFGVLAITWGLATSIIGAWSTSRWTSCA